MLKESLLGQLRSSKEYFDRSSRCLEAKHEGFRPTDDALSTTEQVAHVAQTIDWFLDGAKSGQFDMDFEGHMKDVLKTKTIADARAWVDRSFAAAVEYIETTSIDDLSEPFPDGPIMGGAPRHVIIGGIVEHTAHHRGALTVYARLQGLTPSMPYMDTQPT